MNIREDIKQLKTSDRDLRKFGLVVGGVFLAVGLLFLWRYPHRTPYFAWPGGALMVVGVVLPRALKWVYIAWMSVAFVLGFVMAHVILTLLFFLVITPMGLVARLTGKDFLSLKLDRAAKSYWLPRPQKPKRTADYERQF
jgi:Saxitoxin biosynthesis operon protein SxtJ